MKANLIKEHLSGVFTEIEQCLGFKPKCYIAGGSIASLVLDEKPKDYDVWFELPDYFKEVDKSEWVKNCNAVKTKYATTVILPSGKKIQFVQNRMGMPAALVPQFDFQHTHSYYTQNGNLSYDEDFILRKCLVFKGKLDHPMNTMERVLKFSKRGYYVPPETLETLMLEIRKVGIDKIQNSARAPHAGSL